MQAVACASLISLSDDTSSANGPKPYSGVELDVEGLGSSASCTGHGGCVSLLFFPLFLIDLPFSFALDTLLLPYTLTRPTKQATASLRPNIEQTEWNQLVLQAAQELQYNHEWLSGLALAIDKRAPTLPSGAVKARALETVVRHARNSPSAHAGGEEKYVYEDVLKLGELGLALGSPDTASQVERFERLSSYSIHDVLFLNDFLRWYLRPTIEKELDTQQLHSLGWTSSSGDHFEIAGVKELNMRHFLREGKPIERFSLYPGL